MFDLIVYLVLIIITIFIGRLLGAWMLRINEVIDNQKSLLKELKKLNSNDKQYEILVELKELNSK